MTVRTTARSVGGLALTAMAAIALTGCAAGTTPLPLPSVPVASATRTASAPVTAAPAPPAGPASSAASAVPTVPASPQAGGSDGSTARGTTAGGTTAGGTADGGTAGRTTAPTPAGTGAANRSGACSADHLTASIEGQDGDPLGYMDTMNQRHASVVLRNTGPTSCTVQGWPGVSYVGHGDGTQVGGAATLQRDVPHPTVTLRPGGTAQAHVTALSPSGAADPSTCTAVPVDGVRVYPPGSKRSFFIETSALVTTGGVCGQASVSLMTVEAFIPNP